MRSIHGGIICMTVRLIKHVIVHLHRSLCAVPADSLTNILAS